MTDTSSTLAKPSLLELQHRAGAKHQEVAVLSGKIYFEMALLTDLIGRSDEAGAARTLEAMGKLMVERDRVALEELNAVKEAAQRLREQDLEFGYSYRGHIASDNGYEPIPNIYGEKWYETPEKAETARLNAKRLNSKTFLISRPKSSAASAFERD